MKFKQFIMERMYDSLISKESNKAFNVYINPSKDEVIHIIRTTPGSEASGLLIGDNVYIWASDNEVHLRVAKELNATNAIPFYIKFVMDKFEIRPSEWSATTLSKHNDISAINSKLFNNKYIRKLVGGIYGS